MRSELKSLAKAPIVARSIFVLHLLAFGFLFAANMAIGAPPEVNIAQRQVPQGPLYNTACSLVAPSQLSWFEAYNPIESSTMGDVENAFGVQAADGWFYLWNVSTSPGSPAGCSGPGITPTLYSSPVCSAPLTNALGQQVVGSSLIFEGMADLGGTGNRNYLVAIQGSGSSTNWLYVWAVNPTTCNSGLNLVASGPLLNGQGSAIPGDVMAAVVIGNFDQSGTDEIRVLQAHTSWNYIWKINPGNGQISLLQSGQLLNTAGAAVNVDDLTFVDVSPEDSYGTNQIGQTYLTAIQGGAWAYQWGMGQDAVNSFGLCTGTNCSNKTLMFSLDQGWSNGLLRYGASVTGMTSVYQNVLSVLKAFQAKYTVYALVNPQIVSGANPQALFAFLDLLKSNGIPFFLDVYASDNTTIGYRQPDISYLANINYGLGPYIYDVAGQLPEVVTLQDINTRYGASFAGIRIFETAAQDYAENSICPSDGAPTCTCAGATCSSCAPVPGATTCWPLPNWNGSYYDFFNLTDAQNYIIFANQNQKTVLVADQLWVAPWNSNRAWTPTDSIYRFRSGVETLAADYPGSLILAYDNNESYGSVIRSGLHRMNNWSEYLQQFPGVQGIAVSNQGWMCGRKPGFGVLNCPPEYMALWTGNAFLSNAAQIVQFEPFWYLFAWPSGLINDSVPAFSCPFVQSASCPSPAIGPASAGAGLGAPTPNLCFLAQTLGVQLNSCPS